MNSTINLLLLDDHEMFREGLARTLERERDMKVVLQCSTTAEGLAALTPKVTVVLLDVDLGSERGLGFVEEARKSYDGPILVVTAGISNQEAVNLLQAGVTGILHKRHSGKVLCDSIRAILAGESCLEPKYLTPLIQSVDRSRTSQAKVYLTDRHRALLRYILAGLTNREIAAQLNISEGAVKSSMRLLFDKVNVKSRTQLVKVALEHYGDQL